MRRTGWRLFLARAPEKTKIREMETRFASRRLIFSGGEPVLPHEPWEREEEEGKSRRRRGGGGGGRGSVSLTTAAASTLHGAISRGERGAPPL